MKTLLLALFLPVSASAALVNVQSPALQQLKDADANVQQAADAGTPDRSKAQGGVGFSVHSLQPSGAVDDKGNVVADQPPAPAPGTATPGSGSYVFEGHSPIKGITVYTPKDDPTGKGSTSAEGPKLPFKKGLVYGALGGGGALAAAGIIGLALGGPIGLFAALLGVGAALLGAGAVMFLVNRKVQG